MKIRALRCATLDRLSIINASSLAIRFLLCENDFYPPIVNNRQTKHRNKLIPLNMTIWCMVLTHNVKMIPYILAFKFN